MALLVVGGNDTTRNSMSALIDVMHRFPQEGEKIKVDRSLIPAAANELIRRYSPVVHVRRTVMEEMANRNMRVELAGDIVREGHILVNAINSVPARILVQ
jgi:cytochrome P450